MFCQPLAKGTIGWGDSLALFEDAAFQTHQYMDGFSVGSLCSLVVEEEVPVAEVIDGVA